MTSSQSPPEAAIRATAPRIIVLMSLRMSQVRHVAAGQGAPTLQRTLTQKTALALLSSLRLVEGEEPDPMAHRLGRLLRQGNSVNALPPETMEGSTHPVVNRLATNLAADLLLHHPSQVEGMLEPYHVAPSRRNTKPANSLPVRQSRTRNTVVNRATARPNRQDPVLAPQVTPTGLATSHLATANLRPGLTAPTRLRQRRSNAPRALVPGHGRDPQERVVRRTRARRRTTGTQGSADQRRCILRSLPASDRLLAVRKAATPKQPKSTTSLVTTLVREATLRIVQAISISAARLPDLKKVAAAEKTLATSPLINSGSINASAVHPPRPVARKHLVKNLAATRPKNTAQAGPMPRLPAPILIPISNRNTRTRARIMVLRQGTPTTPKSTAQAGPKTLILAPGLLQAATRTQAVVTPTQAAIRTQAAVITRTTPTRAPDPNPSQKASQTCPSSHPSAEPS
jgi:hypothetical protein